MSTKSQDASSDRKPDKAQANNPETPNLSYEPDPDPAPQVPFPTLGPDDGPDKKPS